MLLLIGTVAFGINYIREAHFINKIENAEISLSNDLSKIIIDGQAFLIGHQQGGILRIIPGDSHELTFRGWAGDISEGKKAQAVIIFYEWEKNRYCYTIYLSPWFQPWKKINKYRSFIFWFFLYD